MQFLSSGRRARWAGRPWTRSRATAQIRWRCVRDAERAGSVLGDRTRLRVGDLADEGSVRAALEGIDATLLCSAHGPAMREQQLGAVRAIAASDVGRVVKRSGDPVSVRAGSPASTGRDHFEVEEALPR